MRKLYSIFILLFCCNALPAQLLNPNFESWTSSSIDKIDTWTPQGKITKAPSAQLGSFAAKIETSLQNFTPTAGVLALTTAFTDGYPYTQKIDTIKVWVKYNIANADTGFFHIEQLNDTNLVRAGSYFITTGTATTWTEIAIPMEIVDTTFNPLSIFIYVSNTLDYDPQMASYLSIDNIRCYYKGILQTNLPNNSFETWTTDTKNDLTNWTSSNELFAQFGLDSINCEQSTIAQNGIYAVKLHTLDLFGQFIPGGIVSGANRLDAANDPSIFPTFSVNKRYASLSGYLKFTKKGTDQGEASIYLFKNGTLVGEGHYYQATSVTNYTSFEAKIVYDGSFTGVPDSATAIFITSRDPQNATGACLLWIDNIQLNVFALGVKTAPAFTETVYPNPFTNQVNIQIKSENATAIIFSMDGKQMFSQKMNLGNNIINTTTLPNAMYLLRVMDGETISTQKIMKH